MSQPHDRVRLTAMNKIMIKIVQTKALHYLCLESASPLWVTQCLSLPSLEVGNLSSVFHRTSCLFPPTLRMTGPPSNLLATIRNGEGGWSGPSGVGLRSSSFSCKNVSRYGPQYVREPDLFYLIFS